MNGLFWTFAVFAFLVGATVGSFLNVVIHRVPAGQSVVRPPSRCPECGQTIRWYDNIPIVSWLVLGGECRDCGTAIPFRYTLVEALTGLMSFGLWWKVAAPQFGAAPAASSLPAAAIALPFGLYFLFLCLLVVITFVDLEHFIIPHAFTAPGMVAGLVAPWIFEWALPAGSLAGLWPPTTGIEAAIGFVAGGVAVLAIYYGYFAVRGIQGIGGGDVTLMAMIGAWLGWPSLVFIFFAASMQGTLAAAAAYVLGGDFMKSSAEILAGPGDEGAEGAEDAESAEAEGRLAVPFGPFITLAAVEHFFLGPWLPEVLSMAYLYSAWH